MDDDNYELMPHEEVINLKRDLELLKKHKGDYTSDTVEHSADKLTRLMNEMLRLLRDASEGMKIEEEEEIMISKKINPLVEKLEIIIDQNNKIAEGLVAIGEMMKANAPKPQAPARQQSNSFPPPGGMPPMNRNIPEPQFNMNTPSMPRPQGQSMPSPPSSGGYGTAPSAPKGFGSSMPPPPSMGLPPFPEEEKKGGFFSKFKK